MFFSHLICALSIWVNMNYTVSFISEKKTSKKKKKKQYVDI